MLGLSGPVVHEEAWDARSERTEAEGRLQARRTDAEEELQALVLKADEEDVAEVLKTEVMLGTVTTEER